MTMSNSGVALAARDAITAARDWQAAAEGWREVALEAIAALASRERKVRALQVQLAQARGRLQGDEE